MAGTEKFESIIRTYYKGAKGSFVVYDISNRESFEHLDKWIDDLKIHGDNDVCIIMVANKCDLEEERRVSLEEVVNEGEQFKIAFFGNGRKSGRERRRDGFAEKY